MQHSKNKIVFGSVVAIVILFIISYSMMVFDDNSSDTEQLQQTLLPELNEPQENYKSKLKAIEALKAKKELNVPSMYDEKLIDSTGVYDPDLPEKRKQQLIDSIYKAGRIQYSQPSFYEAPTVQTATQPLESRPEKSIDTFKDNSIKTKEMGLEHQLFFASDPKPKIPQNQMQTDSEILVAVDGTQVVKTHHRLRMRLQKDAMINGQFIPRNTLVFGFVSFQPHRTLITIENIRHLPVQLTAFDIQDGSKGIYIENSFQADSSREVLDDLVQDANIAGLPQLNGIKRVFRRTNRNVKVTIVDNYQLLLKISNKP